MNPVAATISTDPWTVVTSTAALIALAEFGDKSQLVCMTLAARHGTRPVVLGASVAFAVLNLIAAAFGAGFAALVPERVIAAIVAVTFVVFGVSALRHQAKDDPAVQQGERRSAFVTTLLLVFVAEFGDKTQIAVAGLASTAPPVWVWLGATIALIAISTAGALMGRALMATIPVGVLHKIGGVIFLLYAAFAAMRALAAT